MPPDNVAESELEHYRVFRFGSAVFHEGTRELRVDGGIRALEAKPRQLLQTLLSQANMVVSNEELRQAIWPDRKVVGDGSLSTAVYSVRKALEPHGSDLIKVTSGIGYQIAVPVEISFAPSPPRAPLALKAGASVPGRLQWRLERPLRATPASDVWIVRHEKTHEVRVFKFADTAAGLDRLKREAAISRVLRATLGPRDDIIHISEWDFDHRPFYVESPFGGADIPTWLEQVGGMAAIGPEARLGMVARIARAVAAAHDAGVLHGDLKPTNILVAPDSPLDAPCARLVDFGDGDLTEAVRPELLTTSLPVVNARDPNNKTGTFLYMAPEVMRGGPRTVAADVYALGILLYQMVVGDLERPLAAGWEQDVADQWLRQDIRDAAAGEQSRRFSAALQLAERLETLPARRAEAEAAARAQHLAAEQAAERDDLRHTAELRRVEAAAAKKLLRRTRLAAIALGILCAAMGGLALYAQHERRVAEQSTAVAENTVASLVDDMARGLRERSGVTLPVIQHLLDQAQSTLAGMHRVAPGDPRLQRLQARALMEFAYTYLRQGDLPRALLAARTAASLQQTLLKSSLEDRSLRLEFAESHRWIGDTLLQKHDAAAALAAYRTEAEILAPMATADSSDVTLGQKLARAEEGVGDVQATEGDNKTELATYEAALRVVTPLAAAHPSDDGLQYDLSLAMEKIGDARDAIGDFHGAIAAYQNDLAIRRRVVQIEPQNMRLQRGLGVAYFDVGDEQSALKDFPSALVSYQSAMTLTRERAATDPTNTQWQRDLAGAYSDLGDTDIGLGDRRASVPAYQSAVAIMDTLVKREPDNVGYADDLANMETHLSDDLWRLGERQQAVGPAVRALTLARGLVGKSALDHDLAADLKTAEAVAAQAGVRP